jgi:LmbE family N-acetylglucosaminyl deacetylase
MTTYLDELRPTLLQPYVEDHMPNADHGAINDIVEADTDDHTAGAVEYIHNAHLPRCVRNRYPRGKLRKAIEYEAYRIYDNANSTDYTQRA